MVAPYWEYLHWVGYAVAGVGVWRYIPLAVVRFVAAFTHDEQRARQCMEVLRLARRDASRIPTYLSDDLVRVKRARRSLRPKPLANSLRDRNEPSPSLPPTLETEAQGG